MTRVLLVCGSLQRASVNRAALDVARAAERFAAVLRLARDAGVEQGPLAAHIAAQDEAWLRR
jgi:hypothetical protein